MPTIGDSKKDLSLYFHIPFCTNKCPYCHFYTIPDNDQRQKELFNSFLLEIQKQKKKIKNRQICSIYFGGGTPFLFKSQYIENLLKAILNEVSINSSCEITIEANPDQLSLSHTKLANLKDLGINRISIGVQSFHDMSLKHLHRTHTSKNALQAIMLCDKTGIKNISIDLMYDIPYQTLDSLNHSLSCLHELPITHVSLYNMTIEPHTLFHRQKKTVLLSLPSSKLSKQLLDKTVDYLQNSNFTRYEISAFAKDAYQSIHNTGYWIGREFLGFGPSAFSYFEKKRFKNLSNMSSYAKKLHNNQSPIDFEEQLAYPDNVRELLLIHLRLIKGVHLKRFEEKFGLIDEITKNTIKKLLHKNLLQQKGDILQLSSSGLLFYDTIATMII